MDVWVILLYGFASLLALRSLVGLMHHHKTVFQKEMLIKEREAMVEQTLQKALAQEQSEEKVAA